MIIIVCIYFFLIALSAKKILPNILSPTFLCSAMWTIILFLYIILDHGLYSLSNKVLWSLTLWVSFFIAGTLIPPLVKIKKKYIIYGFNKRICNIYYGICILCIPFILFDLYNLFITVKTIPAFFFYLRASTTGGDTSMFKLGLFRYVFALSLITFFIELYKYNGKNKKRLYVLLIINIIGTITSVAKTSIFYLVIGSLIIYFFKKKRLPIKKIIVPVSLLLIIFCFIQIIRFQYLEQNDVVISMFQVYILGGLPAFDQLIFQDIHSGIFGERTLEFFYKFYEALGGEVQWGMGGDIFYVEMPLRTNVYTAMMPCYVDFDYWGLIFGGFIYGLIAAWSYKLACIGVKWAHVFYSFIAMGIILQFFDNFFYSMLSMSIQFFVWPYIATLPHPKFR